MFYFKFISIYQFFKQEIKKKVTKTNLPFSGFNL